MAALTRVSRLPDACFVRWRLKDGAFADQEITQDQYKALKAGEALVPPADAAADLGNGHGLCWAEYRVTGNRRPQHGDVFPLSYGPEIFSRDTGSTYTHMLIVGKSGVPIKSSDVTGDLDDPRTLTIARYGVVDGVID